MAWFASEQGVEARSGHGCPAITKHGRATQPTRAQLRHAGPQQAPRRRSKPSHPRKKLGIQSPEEFIDY